MTDEKEKVFQHDQIPVTKKAHKKEKTTPTDGTLMADAAVASVVKPVNKGRTDWITLSSGVTCKWIRVPPMVYNEAATRIRQYMREGKPEVPAVQRDGNSPLPNPNDKYYLAAMEDWDDAYEDLDLYMRTAVPIMAGLILKEPVPPKDDWFPEVIAMMIPFGVTEESILNSPYMADPESILELTYKKYVVLSDPAELAAFTRFQAGEDYEVSTAKAVDMFRAD